MQKECQVPDGWLLERLSDLAEIRREQIKPASGDQRPYVALEHIISGGSLNGCGKVSDSISNKTVFREGDTLYGKLRPNLRKVVRVEFDGVCSTDIIAVFNRSGTDSSFLSHLLRSETVYRHAMQGVAGTKMPRTSWNHLAKLTLPVPPTTEQRAIAAILDSIDEVIERTEEVIAATERLRDALLHDLLTRGLPGRHTEWKEVRGLGTIPACWDVVRLGDVGRWLSGGTPSKKNPGFWTGPLPWVSPKDMKTREIYDTRDHISDVAAQQGSRTVPADSVLVVVRGMILAHTFPLAVTRRAVAFNQDIRALECSGNAVPDFVLVSLESQTHRLLQLPTPSTHGTMRVVMDEFLDIAIAMPSIAEQRRITQLLAGIDEWLARVLVEQRQLSSLKSAVADALLSGVVRGSHK